MEIDPRVLEQLIQRLDALAHQVAQLSTLETDVPRSFAARYVSNAAQNIANNTTTIIDFEDVIYDPDGLVTTGANWAYTCPVDGNYHVDAAILFSATANLNPTEAILLDIYRNGSLYSTLIRQTDFSSATIHAWAGGADLVTGCAAGDALDIRVTQTSGVSLALFGATPRYNHVSIWRLP